MHNRHLVRMSDDEVWSFLREPNVATVCTLNADLTIHAVAMFYGFVDGRLAVHTKRGSQKIRNLRRSPTMTVLVESGREYAQLRGVQVVGRCTLHEDPSLVQALSAEMGERYGWPRPSSNVQQPTGLHNRICISLKVDRIASWDHTKLSSAG